MGVDEIRWLASIQTQIFNVQSLQDDSNRLLNKIHAELIYHNKVQLACIYALLASFTVYSIKDLIKEIYQSGIKRWNRYSQN